MCRTTSWSAAGARAAHRRADRQLGRARAERPAVQPHQPTYRPGSQRHAVEPLAAGTYCRAPVPTPTRSRTTTASATAPAARASSSSTCALGYAHEPRRAAGSTLRRRLQPDQPRELREPERATRPRPSSCADGAARRARRRARSSSARASGSRACGQSAELDTGSPGRVRHPACSLGRQTSRFALRISTKRTRICWVGQFNPRF